MEWNLSGADTPTPLLIVSAIIPAVLLLLYIYKKDRLEPEPPGLLIRLVIFGVISTFLAIITETVGTFILDLFFEEQNVVYNLLMYFIVVACSEEGFKYLLLKLTTWRNPAFNCQFDAVVYAVFVALGFALWENIGYVLMYGFGTALIRAITAVPGHASFGVFMGAWYGIAKRYENAVRPEKARLYRRLAFVLPVLVHGFYDFVATMESDVSALIFLVFIVLMFFLAFLIVRRTSRGDTYI